jgi:hypothetical protein
MFSRGVQLTYSSSAIVAVVDVISRCGCRNGGFGVGDRFYVDVR